MVMDRRRFLLSSLSASLAPSLFRVSQAEQAATAADAWTPALQRKLASDPLRPQFHLLPKHNWMNDPCAPRYHRGEYHMFFQYNPNAAVWGDMHWNHATSPDMIHWRHQPVAIAPGPSAFDSFGIFTGSVLPGTEIASVLYTGVSKSSHELETIRGEGLREVQCLATSTDPELRVWQKLEKPVIDSPPPGVKVVGFRDPCPWKDGDTWYLGIGSGFAGAGGAVLLYTSKDGRAWSYLHPLAQGKWNGGSQSNPVDTGEMWECPDFFPLDGKHVLLYSTERKVYWNVGTFDKKELRFHMETSGLLDHGSYYAMKSMVDAKGRRILWGWVEETRSPEACTEAGWAGSMALPRLLSIDEDNRLRMQVPPEFRSLLHDSATSTDTRPARPRSLTIRDRAGHLAYTFKPGDAPGGVELRSAGSGLPLLSLAHSGTGSARSLRIGDAVLALHPGPDGLSTVELWMDGSVVEIFVDRTEALTLRNYTLTVGDLPVAVTGAPTDPASDPAPIAGLPYSITVSGVRPISPDRLTG